MFRLSAFLLQIIIIFCSCQHTPAKTVRTTLPVKSDTVENVFDFVDMSDIDTLQLPAGFRRDSTFFLDKGRHAVIGITVPKYKGNNNFDTLLSFYINKRLQEYTAFLDTLIKEDSSMLQTVPSTFIVCPVAVFKNKNLVSYCFLINSDHAGAVHPFTEYYSFNYDIYKKREISLFDLFNIRSRQDSGFLKSIINTAIDTDHDRIKKLYELDFNIESDSISFNFNDYEIGSYAEGLTRAKISKQSAYQIINDKYRYRNTL